MAVYNLQEQEQIDNLKAWWKQYHGLIGLVIVVCGLTFGAITGWRYYQDKQAVAASELYVQLEAALNAGDKTKARNIAAVITQNYPHTGYAELAALVGARAAADVGDLTGAQVRLKWLVENAADDATRDLARLRLAAILLDQKNYPDALTLLETTHGAAWDALYAGLRGDVLVAQGRNEEARDAYRIAIDKSTGQTAYRTMVQVKLDALGGAK